MWCVATTSSGSCGTGMPAAFQGVVKQRRGSFCLQPACSRPLRWKKRLHEASPAAATRWDSANTSSLLANTDAFLRFVRHCGPYLVCLRTRRKWIGEMPGKGRFGRCSLPYLFTTTPFPYLCTEQPTAERSSRELALPQGTSKYTQHLVKQVGTLSPAPLPRMGQGALWWAVCYCLARDGAPAGSFLWGGCMGSGVGSLWC